jgi:adenine-specific DNA-methyltransferase
MPWLEWNNRKQDLAASDKIKYRLLQPVQKLSVGDEDTANMLIEGDNVEALKALLPYYGGQVKCAFLDPPYNTTSDFEHYDDNLEHSQWLSMMYPRLELTRELLKDDGAVFITVDDNESHYLKVIMDEIFGRKNFVANAVWQKKYTVANDAKWFSSTHDHVLIYAKNKDKWFPNRLGRSAEMDARYKNPDKHPKGDWKATPLHAKSGSKATASGTFRYRFKNGVEWTPPAGTFSRYSEASLAAYDEGDEIWFGKDGAATPSRKTFLSELASGGVVPSTLWMHTEVGNNHDARTEAKAFVKGDPFKTPKPEKLIQRILELATEPGDIVLDSFLGSGTTAAVAQKMGRRWIGVEMGEHARTHCYPRLKAVVDGEQGGISKPVGWTGGGGFRFYTLGPHVFDEEGQIRQDVRFDNLAAHIWFSETGVPRSPRTLKAPLLGFHGGTAYYLLFNGILHDIAPNSGNVLTAKVLRALSVHEGPKVIYGEACTLSDEVMAEQEIVFRQIPFDIKSR